jgi:fumarate reductase flavoprotein subunit
MLTKTTGKRIIVEKDRVAGLEALDAQGKPFVIKTKAVVIATGGFNNSDELIAKWTRFNPTRVEPAVRLHKVGEGIQMAMAQGADTKGFGLMVGQGNPRGPGLKHPDWVTAVAGSPVLWVNALGERFVDESIAMDFPMASNSIYGQSGNFAWAIWDEETARHWKEEGIDLSPSVPLRIGTMVDVMAEITSGVAAGNRHVAMADSVPELARKIGVDPARLQQTIDRYNGFCGANKDAEFSKDPRWLRPVKKGKLMAARLVAWSQVSIGGVRVTPRMEVIKQTGAPIPGIYAAGADAGGLWGDTYTVWTSGIMLSWCSTSGRLAGANAAAFVKSSNK